MSEYFQFYQIKFYRFILIYSILFIIISKFLILNYMNKIESTHTFNQEKPIIGSNQNPINKFTSKRFLRSKTCEEIYKQFSAKKERQRHNKSLSKAKHKHVTTNKKYQGDSRQTKQNYSNSPKKQNPLQYAQRQHQKLSNRNQNETICNLQEQNGYRIRYSDRKYENPLNHKTRMSNRKQNNKTRIFQNSKQNEEEQKYSIFDLNVSQMNSQIITDLKMTTIILQQKLNLKDEEMHLLSENYQKLREQYQKLLKNNGQQKIKNQFQIGETSPRFKQFKKQSTYLRQNQEVLKRFMIAKKRDDIQKKFQQLQQRVSEQFQSEELKNSNLVKREKQKQIFQNKQVNIYSLNKSEASSQKKNNFLNQGQSIRKLNLSNQVSRFKPTAEELQKQSQSINRLSQSQVVQDTHTDLKSYNQKKKNENRQQSSSYAILKTFKPFSPIDIFQASSIPIQNTTTSQQYSYPNPNSFHILDINSTKMLKPSKDTNTSNAQSETNKDNFAKNKFQVYYPSLSPTKNYINNIPKKSRPPLPKSSQKPQSNQLISLQQLSENQTSATNLFQKALNKTNINNSNNSNSKKNYNPNLKNSNKNKLNYINKFIQQNINQNQSEEAIRSQKTQKMISDFILQSQSEEVRSDIKQIK